MDTQGKFYWSLVGPIGEDILEEVFWSLLVYPVGIAEMAMCMLNTAQLRWAQPGIDPVQCRATKKLRLGTKQLARGSGGGVWE